MISYPRNEQQKRVCHDLLAARNGGAPSADAHYLLWVKDGMPEWVVSFDYWMGKSCFLSQASTHTRPFPRQLVKTVFVYAFDVLGMRLLFAGCDASNEPALRINRFLGFDETARFPGIMPNDQSLIILTMRRDQCRWVEQLNG